ncbi:hypothetical protein [Massilia sp. GCM10023247]|uniref:hypothetical protein n=1 Tax=Massilia sp. GCM10023247 TaxID=3252643 RepID=UPI0036D2C2F9
MVARRGGLAYARSEIALQAYLHRNGFQSTLSSLLVGAARATVFASPLSVRQLVYRAVLRSKARS